MNPLGRLVGLGKACVRKILLRSQLGRAYYERRKARQRQKELETLQRYGGMILGKVHAILSREKIAYCVWSGTLLGCVRDGGLMAHDDDIDIAILPGDVSVQRLIELFEAEGFKFFWAWKCQGRITEFAVTYKGVHIDFYFLKDSGDHSESHWYMPLEGVKYPDEFSWSAICTSLPKIRDLKALKLPRYNICVNIPENYDEILSVQYGAWRIPDTNWKSTAEIFNGYRRLLTEFGRQVSRESLFDA